MNDNAKVFSLVEMREMMIDTSDYQMMEEVGEFIGTLEMKAQGHKKSIRIFLTLDDGRKIITPIFWWQTYLGFYYMPIGTKLRLFYSESNQNKVPRQMAERYQGNHKTFYVGIIRQNCERQAKALF